MGKGDNRKTRKMRRRKAQDKLKTREQAAKAGSKA